MIGAPKIFNGSHDLTTPLWGTVCVVRIGCDLHIHLYIQFELFAITNYEDA